MTSAFCLYIHHTKNIIVKQVINSPEPALGLEISSLAPVISAQYIPDLYCLQQSTLHLAGQMESLHDLEIPRINEEEFFDELLSAKKENIFKISVWI